MNKNKSILLLIIGILLLLVGGYVFFLDPLIGVVGFVCGIWTVFLAIKALRGSHLFKSADEDNEK